MRRAELVHTGREGTQHLESAPGPRGGSVEEVLGGGKEFSPREPQPGGVSTCGQLWRSPNPSADTDARKGVSPALELE